MIPAGVFSAEMLGGWLAGRRFSAKLKKQRRAALEAEKSVLPEPGRLYRDQLKPLGFDRLRGAIQVVSLPVLMWVAYQVLMVLEPGIIGRRGLTLMLVLGAIAEIYLLIRFITAYLDHRTTLREYKTKLVTAQALKPFESRGDFVCHGLRLGHLDIDHILISPKGIFTIHTHPWSVVLENSDTPNNVVTYDGRGIFFPKKMDDNELMMALDAGELLSAWLSRGLNMPVASRAIVAMPGWQVKRTSADGIPVVNPQQFESLFAHISARPLTPEQIQTITDLLILAYHRNRQQEN